MSKRSNSTFSQKFLRRSLSTSQNPKRSTLKQKMTSLKRKASSKRVSKISSSKAFKDMINKYYQTPNEKLDLKLFRSPSRNKGSSYLKVLDCTPQTELSSTQKFSKSKTKFQRKKIEKTLKSKKRHNTSSGSTMNKSKSIWETYNPITDFSTVLKAQKRSQFILKNGFLIDQAIIGKNQISLSSTIAQNQAPKKAHSIQELTKVMIGFRYMAKKSQNWNLKIY
jgi:hypothetical protein